MAQLREWKLEDACEHSSCFMYIFASKAYIDSLPRKYKNKILVKKANELLLLSLSVKKYEGNYSLDKRNEWKDKIAQSFTEVYGMSPEQALDVLAAGGRVAGKDWEKGVFGVGALKQSTFSGININGNAVTVDPTTGHIFNGTTDLTDNNNTVFDEVNGKTIATIYMTGDVNGMQFSSYYHKTSKKYYAGTYTKDGKKYKANGKETSNAESASVWENVNFAITNIWDMLKKLLEAFGVTVKDTPTGEMLTTENTFPSQSGDGYCTKEAGLGAGGIALLAIAGGALIYGGLKPKKGKKKSK